MVLAASGVISTIIVSLIVLGLVVQAVRTLRKNRKDGGCGCGCSGCSANCHEKNLDDIK